ncbi:hypothetical protein NM688_g5144 [Phlebia brevispora]|uniref:Uncharacterized protein n=1 Tax=Phlebia brevispora TaxID=194682 RepID=A0ACC1T057_9APHY|nr:hypothetical protein NM688_g5144 [Phlebia brevispora]
MSLAATPPGGAIPALNLNTTIGAVLIGGVFSAVFYGITASQTAVYYQRAQADPLIIKLVVGVLWILDTFDMCLISHTLYWYLITNYGNFLALQGPTWSLIMHVLVTDAVGYSDHSPRHVYIKSVQAEPRKPGRDSTDRVSLIDLTCAIAINVKADNAQGFVPDLTPQAIVYLQFVAGFIGDALAAGYLCYLLHKSRTGVRRTESVINVLTAYTVNSGRY